MTSGVFVSGTVALWPGGYASPFFPSKYRLAALAGENRGVKAMFFPPFVLVGVSGLYSRPIGLFSVNQGAEFFAGFQVAVSRSGSHGPTESSGRIQLVPICST